MQVESPLSGKARLVLSCPFPVSTQETTAPDNVRKAVNLSRSPARSPPCPLRCSPPFLPLCCYTFFLLVFSCWQDLVNIFKLFIPQLLSYPNPTDPLNGEAAALLMRDPKAYENRIRECVRLHASDPVHLDGTPVAVVPATAAVAPTATAAATNANANANTATGTSASSSSSGGAAAAAAASTSSASASDESDVSSSDGQPAVSRANATTGSAANGVSAAVDIKKEEGGDGDAMMGEAATAAGASGDAKRRAAAPGNNGTDAGASSSSSRSSSGSDFMMEVGESR